MAIGLFWVLRWMGMSHCHRSSFFMFQHAPAMCLVACGFVKFGLWNEFVHIELPFWMCGQFIEARIKCQKTWLRLRDLSFVCLGWEKIYWITWIWGHACEDCTSIRAGCIMVNTLHLDGMKMLFKMYVYIKNRYKKK